jgi:hypothetical protein
VARVWGEYPDHDHGVALLREVVPFIDTADVYGPHSNEELIREALHPASTPKSPATPSAGGSAGVSTSRIASRSRISLSCSSA